MSSRRRAVETARFIGSIVLLWLSAASAASQFPLYVVGSAVDAADGEYLYSEYHYCSADRLSCDVEYRDADARTLASKTLSYSVDAYAPTLKMQDFRSGVVHDFYPGKTDAEVVDAGFDNFVRARWNALMAGEVVEFSFQVLGIENPVAMRAKRMQDSCEDEGLLCLRVEVSSWLLGFIAEPIDLVYATDSRRLLRFVGVSNLKDGRGKSQMVEISYQYLGEGQQSAIEF